LLPSQPRFPHDKQTQLEDHNLIFVNFAEGSPIRAGLCANRDRHWTSASSRVKSGRGSRVIEARGRSMCTQLKSCPIPLGCSLCLVSI